jgi:hypothetical protein
VAGVVTAPGRFNLDYIRAQITEHHSAVWSGQYPSQVDHANTLQ